MVTAGQLEIHRLCIKCPCGVTRMIQLRHTKTWICPECSGTEYYTPRAASKEWFVEQEEKE